MSLLDLTLPGLTVVPGGLAAARVEGLVLSTGHLASVPSRAFEGMAASLTALGLPGNLLARAPVEVSWYRRSPPQALAPLLRLARLDLSGNLLPGLPCLPALPALQFLNLKANRISRLPAGALASLPRLTSLRLGVNSLTLTAILHSDLQHLSHLSSLDLSSNRLAGPLSPPSLDLFPPNLRSLDLSLNTITSLASRTFSSLTSLTSLSLEGNLVEEVQGEAFQGLTSLTSLDLSHNSILTLATSSLAGLPSLTTLNLAHNHLQVVDSSMVAPSSPLLASLLLMDNDITTVVGLALEQATHLEELDLTGESRDYFMACLWPVVAL